MGVFRTNDYSGNGLADGLTQGLGLASAYKKMKEQDGFSEGLSEYVRATDEASKQDALSKMAMANPTETAGFITKQKMFGGSDNGLKGEFGSLLKYRMTLDDKDPTAKMIDLRLGVLGKDPTQFNQYQYAGETGKGQAKLGYEPQLAGLKEQAQKEVGLAYNPQIKSAEKQAEEKIAQQLSYEKERNDALKEYEQLEKTYNRLFGEGGLIGKADLEDKQEDNVATRMIDYAKRKTPTGLLNKEVQIARQEIMNTLGQLRLDQMQYLKGAISDKEQEMLSDFVSGDISKYTPSQIRGTFNSLMNKLTSKYGVLQKEKLTESGMDGSVEKDVVIDASEYFK